MVKLEDAVVARYVIKGSHFEILIDPDASQQIRDGKEIDILSSVAIDVVFKDSKKGDRASDENLQKMFNTTNFSEIAKQIIQHGEIQLTTEQRRKMQENKKKQIVAEIARNAFNPQTKSPHPPQRIEAAIDEARVSIDPFKPVDVQIKTVLAAIRSIIPIKIDKISVEVKLSAQDVPKIYGDIKSFGTIVREEYKSNGSWVGTIELPAGLQTDFYNKLNTKTKGNVETRIVK
ncbi:MAG: ribosome assembly factor SBDS [Thermoplasmata archaeon]